jgi:hypothetical protein
LNKIYLAASNLKIAEIAFSTYNFFQHDSSGGYYFLYYYNFNYNPQGLYIIISPPGLFESFSKEIIIRSSSQQQAEFKPDKACKF